MRIALLYPPPWKIPMHGEAPDAGGDGPPSEYRDGDLDADFFQTPYGLFVLGAQALRAGHQVKVLNLSAFAWRRVEEVIAALDADLFGMSCWTANRRGVGLTARLIKRLHPRAHVVVGGPHATPLPRHMLAYHPDIDTVAIGESERTFMELVERLEAGQPTGGIAGTAYRVGDRIEIAPERPAVEDLDALASPHDYFDTHIVMTSRGCPWRCTFCGAEASWGRGYRAQSVPYVLDALEKAVARAPVKMIQIKDDTFTTNRKRVLALCRGIRERGIKFVWSCDTRVDVLGDELLREMRLAGCERLSLGVESGSQKILDAIDKKITVDEIVGSTELAKKYGIKLRYYMMVGNRGETRETLQESLRFLERARPHQYLFAALSVYPGTRDYDLAVEQGWLDPDFYFERDFQELKCTFDASDEDTAFLRAWFDGHKGLHEPFREGVASSSAWATTTPRTWTWPARAGAKGCSTRPSGTRAAPSTSATRCRAWRSTTWRASLRAAGTWRRCASTSPRRCAATLSTGCSRATCKRCSAAASTSSWPATTSSCSSAPPSRRSPARCRTTSPCGVRRLPRPSAPSGAGAGSTRASCASLAPERAATRPHVVVP
jgi:anaerobic magnesium-protoporphyrin IX monomethyl ester cyclase